jgi:hypothetical protein
LSQLVNLLPIQWLTLDGQIQSGRGRIRLVRISPPGDHAPEQHLDVLFAASSAHLAAIDRFCGEHMSNNPECTRLIVVTKASPPNAPVAAAHLTPLGVRRYFNNGFATYEVT